ncbi:TrbG/VirB9 family P-type conjugative transfer protein [Hydrogenophaga sp. NFH-34]|uniref:TrbG/VirB9 family P-type conjugative transfer protein n=1 Tax=Hydrogenophaga sp. NFH-34 TaxID=2744446 RepID=UPI001F27388C|nr:TrbG/VirB9 family P-type conjugative transfer protein [Hydrogenophaga sp. NFH-34]
MKKLLFTIVGTLIAASALAQSTSSISAPVPGNLDSRIVTFAYTPDVVFKLPVTVGMHTHIMLGQDEELVEVPRLGDKIRWRVEGNERNLYIKSTVPDTKTSLSLVTSRRTYQFELVATQKGDERVQQVAFSYPDQEESIRVATRRSLEAERTMAEMAASKLRAQNLAAEPIDPSQLRFLKVTTKNEQYARIHAYTNGIQTWIRMPNGVQDLPAVFMVSVNERGKESLMPVNYSVGDRKSILDRDALIIDRTAPIWMLQVGEDIQVRLTQE